MNKRALLCGLFYSLSAIIFKLIILLGGFTLSKFGFYYSNIVSVFFIIPFIFLAIYLVREKDYMGVIRGREALRAGLTVVAVGAVIVSVYNYVEFVWMYKDIAVNYYNSPAYLEVLNEQLAKNSGKFKTEDFPKIITEQISSLSASRSMTAKLFPLIFMGLTGSFFAAVLLKRSEKPVA